MAGLVLDRRQLLVLGAAALAGSTLVGAVAPASVAGEPDPWSAGAWLALVGATGTADGVPVRLDAVDDRSGPDGARFTLRFTASAPLEPARPADVAGLLPDPVPLSLLPRGTAGRYEAVVDRRTGPTVVTPGGPT